MVNDQPVLGDVIINTLLRFSADAILLSFATQHQAHGGNRDFQRPGDLLNGFGHKLIFHNEQNGLIIN